MFEVKYWCYMPNDLAQVKYKIQPSNLIFYLDDKPVLRFLFFPFKTKHVKTYET